MNMLEDILYTISNLFPSMPHVGNVPAEALPISTISSGAGALILGKFTGSLGGVTLPLNYSALFIGALVSNWIFGGIDLHLTHVIEQPMLVTMGGMTIAAMMMMWWFQNEAAQR